MTPSGKNFGLRPFHVVRFIGTCDVIALGCAAALPFVWDVAHVRGVCGGFGVVASAIASVAGPWCAIRVPHWSTAAVAVLGIASGAWWTLLILDSLDRMAR